MGDIAIVENGKVTYRGELPNSFRNSNMNVTGLCNSEGKWETLNAKGIFELIETTPSYDPALYKVDGYVDDIQANKVVQTWIVRAKTQEELDVEAETAKAIQNEQKISVRMRRLAIDSLQSDGELLDYEGS